MQKMLSRDKEGVGFFWNCNDFNPSVGGLTSPVRLYYKPQVYLTLPLYSNLLTKGCYVYGSDYEIGMSKDKNGMGFQEVPRRLLRQRCETRLESQLWHGYVLM